jgi:hypothetical protein
MCCTGLTGVEPFCGSRQVSPAGTGLTGVPLRSQVLEVGSWFLGLVDSSGCVDLADWGSESETCVGSRLRLVGVSISFEKNFYRLPFTPPLSGSPLRSFTTPQISLLFRET